MPARDVLQTLMTVFQSAIEAYLTSGGGGARLWFSSVLPQKDGETFIYPSGNMRLALLAKFIVYPKSR